MIFIKRPSGIGTHNGCNFYDPPIILNLAVMIGIFWQQMDFGFRFSSSKYVRKHTSEVFPQHSRGGQIFWVIFHNIVYPFGCLRGKNYMYLVNLSM